MIGRPVTLDKPAERIASIPIPLASTIIAIDGSTKKLVGMNPLAKSAIEEGILGQIFPEAKDISSAIAGTDFIPNVEELASVNPDLVIQWGDIGDGAMAPLLNAGLKAMFVTYGTEEQGRQFMRITAKAMNKEERINPLIDWREKVQSDIQEKTDKIANDQKPRTLYLQRALTGLIAVGPGQSYMDFWIRLGGGVNAAKDITGAKPVSPEQVAQWDPEVIFLNSFEGNLTTDFIYNDPVLSMTKAAKEKRVYKMPLGGYRWDPPNQESPLTWMWVANLLQPGVFKFDLRAEMQKAYKSLYGYDLTASDIDEVLWVKMQGSSKNYAIFKAD
ncbi:ABC transporter substrate-binding protein [Microvirga sp. W0021]|uniref:ABC transporter substrate-binding protein n=1 Tax=Hohaiivirga grylli TaxID=3133970 RepID=A0ABV0BGX1_9HYPH